MSLKNYFIQEKEQETHEYFCKGSISYIIRDDLQDMQKELKKEVVMNQFFLTNSARKDVRYISHL